MKGDPTVELVERFEAARPRLLSLAHRLVGSHHDAEDAVQTAWLRVQAADADEVANPDGWFTTVTARLCIDQLRARKRRGELPLSAEGIPTANVAADEEFLRRDEASRALLVLLNELSERQRVAFVLHDLFAVPFEQIAAVLDTNPAAAKKLASRARIRLRDAGPAAPGHRADHLDIVEAFLAAARGGDIARLVTLMAPDAVRTVDPVLLPAGARTTARGATVIAKQTRGFIDRFAAAVPVLIEGRAGAIIAPGGHGSALIHFEIHGGLVTGVGVTPYEPTGVTLAAAG